MTTPTPEALAQARSCVDQWVHGQEIVKREPLSVWIDRRGKLVEIFALALTEQARETERLTEALAALVEEVKRWRAAMALDAPILHAAREALVRAECARIATTPDASA